MVSRYPGLICLLTFLVCLTGCEPGPVTWLSPGHQETFTTPPDIEFRYENDQNEFVYGNLLLNNRDISEHIEWQYLDKNLQQVAQDQITNPNGAYLLGKVPGEVIADNLRQGINTLSIDIRPNGVNNVREFTYDSQAPEIIVLHSNAHNPNVNPVKIYGLAVDSSAIESVYINNTSVTLEEDGRFEIEVPRQDIYTFTTRDDKGFEAQRQFADLYTGYQEALNVRINDEGFSSISSLALKLLNEIDFFNLAKGNSPIIDLFREGDTTWGGTWSAGYLYDLDIKVQDVDIWVDDNNKTQLSLTLEDAKVKAAIQAVVESVPVFALPVNGWIRDISAGAEISISAEQGKLQAQVHRLDFSYNENNIDIYVPSSNLVEYLAYQLTINRLLDRIKTILLSQDFLPNLLENTLQDMAQSEIDKIFGKFPEVSEDIAIPINDFAELTLDVNVNEVEAVNHGYNIALGARVSPSSEYINDIGISQPLGPIYTPGALPAASMVQHAGFGLILNANLLNQALVAAHSVGLTQITVIDDTIYVGYPIDGSDVSAVPRDMPAGFEQYYSDEINRFLQENGDDLSAEPFIKEQLPTYPRTYTPAESPRHPTIGDIGSTRVLVDNHVPAKVEISQMNGQPQFLLSVHNIAISLQEKVDASTYQTNFGTTINAKVPLIIDINADGSLNVAITDALEIEMVNFTLDNTTYQPSDNIVVQFLTNEVNRQIRNATSLIVDELKEPLQGIRIPSFSCMDFHLAHMQAVGNNHQHLGASADLVAQSQQACDLL